VGTPRVKKAPYVLPPIENWSVSNYGIKLHVNPDWGVNLYAGMSLDVEDDEQDNFVGLGIYDPKLKCCYYWSSIKNIPVWIRNEPPPPFIAHNGRSDIEKLRKWGFDVSEANLLWDTLLMQHILDSSQRKYGLKEAVKREFGVEYPAYEDIVGKHKTKCPNNVVGCCGRITLDKQPLELVAAYNACDCYWTHRLYELQKSKCI
jgi:DNA polymerase I-like protein with 3'-5' exonuclease and polymerase domains